MNAADLRKHAEEESLRLTGEGRILRPVIPSGKNMAARFWGRAWMKHLARSETYGMRLAPGRTLLRAGCVIDLQVEEGLVNALVVAGGVHEITIRIRPLDEEEKEILGERCSGRIASWIDLLEGKLGDDLLDLLCDPDSGILPNASDWKMSCPCDDYADPCCHAAAALYAVGVLLDKSPGLLFTLRGVDARSLIPGECDFPQEGGLGGSDLSSLFGIDLQNGVH